MILKVILTLSFLLLTPSITHFFFFFNDTAPPEIYPLPLHAALPISPLVARRDGRLRCRYRQQVLGRLGATRERERGLYLPVFIHVAPHLDGAPEQVARDLVPQVVGDQRARAREHAVRQRHAARAQPPHDVVHHIGGDLKVRALHASRGLRLERVAGPHIPVRGDLVPQRLHEGALLGGERVGHYEQVGADAPAAAHEATAVGVEHQRRIDLARVPAELGGLGLRQLVFLTLALALDGAPAGRVPARRGELERHLRRQRIQRLHEPLAERRRPHDDGPIV